MNWVDIIKIIVLSGWFTILLLVLIFAVKTPVKSEQKRPTRTTALRPPSGGAGLSN